MSPEPAPDNRFLADHVDLLRASFRRWSGRDLIESSLSSEDAARRLYLGPRALLSHGAGADPVFTYASRAAQILFEMSWAEMMGLPSRLSAEPASQAERARLLARVSAGGFIEDYAGVRISRTGRRFMIAGAVVWNLVDAGGSYRGQAAMFSQWTPVESPDR
jgi:hypothetical protein